jgi:spoIIIJ-associated protein
MSRYKEFQGKTLDDAIREACDYYGVAREKLEIEIVSDAKTGIFGLVGVKKATIKASRMLLDAAVSALMRDSPVEAEEPARDQGRGGSVRTGKRGRGQALRVPDRDQAGEAKESSARGRTAHEHAGQQGMSAEMPENPVPDHTENSDSLAADGSREAGRDRAKARNKKSGAAVAESSDRGRGSLPEKKAAVAVMRTFSERGGKIPVDPLAVDSSADAVRDDLPDFHLENCDKDHLFHVVSAVVLRLVDPIVGNVPCEVTIHGRRIRACLDCGDAVGLLVGRDGQTLAAVEYLAARIVARQLGGLVRLQVDAGKYRERQDDKLKDVALALAAKVKETGRPQSTRSLSAYQRRLVHLALEGDDMVETRSKGEGAQRRVVVLLKSPPGGSSEKRNVVGTDVPGPDGSDSGEIGSASRREPEDAEGEREDDSASASDRMER